MFGKTRLGNILKLHVAAIAGLLIAASSAQALGTSSDTDINNKATITYEVLGSPQTEIESSPTGNSTPGSGLGTNTTFKVDNKIDFTVDEISGGYTAVSPGASDMAVAFTLRNDGNTVQDFSFSYIELTTGAADPFTGTDDFDGTHVGIFVESGGQTGYQPLQDVATYADEVLENGVVTVYVVRDIGAGVADGESSGVILVAQVAQGGTGSSQGADITTDDSAAADLPGTVQIVFAEGTGTDPGDSDYNGQHSDTDAFLVQTVALQITKASEVVWDPINTTTNPKAIPGARVEYTITVANTAGTGTATNVTVSDDLSTEIGLGTIDFYVDGYGSGTGLEVTAGNLYSGSATALSNGSGDDEGTWDSGASTITVDGIEVGPSGSAIVKYQVTIQ